MGTHPKPRLAHLAAAFTVVTMLAQLLLPIGPTSLVANLPHPIRSLAAGTPAGAIVGGTNLDIARAPWTVSLFRRDAPRGHFCTATILSPTAVVTAAHCVKSGEIQPGQLFVRAGVTSRHNPAGQNIGVRSITRHPGFSDARPGVRAPDIAVLHLRRRLTFNDQVRPIAIATPTQVAATRRAVVSGWGSIDPFTTRYAHRLKRAAVKLLTDNTCIGHGVNGARFRASNLQLNRRV